MTNEREASVSSFYFDSNTGELRPVQTIPTIPEGYSGPRVAPSNIRMHPNAKFIYSANRGDDSIAIFSIDEATGRMTPVDTVKTGGRGPREMNFEPSGKFFFVCNLQSNDVTSVRGRCQHRQDDARTKGGRAAGGLYQFRDALKGIWNQPQITRITRIESASLA